ncbi:DUF7689 domain-containing protein [Pedobacter arcticus]|uniref:DUF7689 domain-containing protein n=1 Tax=Pedobacter arcticus TaxID=752140 RepID=UPI0002F5B3FB|nr:hypothetical protein [Pedobacter arcticus]
MLLDSPENRISVEKEFPALANDPYFKITSPDDEKYNCIAWACGINNIWYWPFPSIDGVVTWPITEKTKEISSLIKLFEMKGFKLCEGYDFDPTLVKIALYVDSNNEFTHAARQNRDGLWKSKLGQWFDIIHGTPYTIENNIYGKAEYFMSAKF